MRCDWYSFRTAIVKGFVVDIESVARKYSRLNPGKEPENYGEFEKWILEQLGEGYKVCNMASISSLLVVDFVKIIASIDAPTFEILKKDVTFTEIFPLNEDEIEKYKLACSNISIEEVDSRYGEWFVSSSFDFLESVKFRNTKELSHPCLEDVNLHDVMFVVGSEQQRIGCNKSALAVKSKVFYRMFFGPMRSTQEESEIVSIEFPDFEPDAFITFLLCLLCSDKIETRYIERDESVKKIEDYFFGTGKIITIEEEEDDEEVCVEEEVEIVCEEEEEICNIIEQLCRDTFDCYIEGNEEIEIRF